MAAPRRHKSIVMVEALQEYLKGNEWKQNIEYFVRANSRLFRSGDFSEYTHEHHAVWKAFQDIAEAVLDVALSNVGGTIEDLEKALDEIVHQPSKGPKDEHLKEVLEKLLSFESFPDFAKMMHDAAVEGRDDGGGGVIDSVNSARKGKGTQSRDNSLQRHYNDLVAFGFSDELIQVAMESGPPNASLEDLVIILSELQEEEGKKRGSRGSSNSKTTRPTQSRARSKYSHIEEFANEVNEDSLELHAKFVCAGSVVDTFNNGDVSESVVAMLNWAHSMEQLQGDIESAYEENIPFSEMKHLHPGGLIEYYRSLEEMRREIDSSEAAGGILSDAEMKRMAELDSIAALGTEDEQLLHSLISRHDEVSKEVNKLHQRYALLASSENGIAREQLEHLYLYLKEKLTSGEDLAKSTEEVHEEVYSMVSSSKGADVVNLLLDMHVMEDEQKILRTRIDTLLNSPSRASDAKHGDESKAFFDGSKEKSDNGECEDGFSSPASKTRLSSLDRRIAEEKTSSRNADMERSSKKDGDEEKDAKISNVDTHPSSYLDALKKKHKESLQKLRNSLDTEKRRRLKSLEDRLSARQKRKITGEGDDLDEQGESEQELTNELNAISSKFDEMKDSLVSGFKKRCLYEIKAAKAKGSPLSENEKLECYRNAADALKQRYERDNKALLESLEAERAKQRRKIKKELAKRRGKTSNQAEVDSLEEWAHQELQNMNSKFDWYEAEALSRPQDNTLLALSSIFIDESLLNSDSPKKMRGTNAFDDAIDENYLDDDTHLPSQTQAWLDSTEQLAKAYVTAGIQLQINLQKMHRQGEDLDLQDEEDEDQRKENESFQALSSHMTKVMVEAFNNQVASDAASESFSPQKRGGGVDGNGPNAEQIKASILKEFERTKGDYEEALKRSKMMSKDRLERRRQRQQADSDKMNSEESKDESSAALSNIIQSFLEDPMANADSSSSSSSLSSLNGGTSSVSMWPGGSKGGGGAYSLPPLSKGRAKLEPIGGARVVDKAWGGFGSRRVLGHGFDSDEKKERDEEDEEEERRGIVSRYEEKQKKLLNDLETQMMQKKKLLEERLQKKRDRRALAYEQTKNREVLEFTLEHVDEEEQNASEELDRLQESFDTVVALVKNADSSQLQATNASLLIKTLERIMDGEIIEKLPVQSSHVKREQEERAKMQEDVRRISNVYNEEKQKLDLMMMMQQARQRQTLQRKLLERQAGRSSSASAESSNISSTVERSPPPKFEISHTPLKSGGIGAGAGYSPDAVITPDKGVLSRGLSYQNMRK